MGETELIHGDRRLNRRYEFEAEMRFSYEDQGVKCFGSGVTGDLSRGGARFLTDQPPPDGAEVEIRIAWPFLLQDVCPLELIMWGAIVRTDAAGTVLRMRNYEFRTCGDRSFLQTGAQAGSYSLVG